MGISDQGANLGLYLGTGEERVRRPHLSSDYKAPGPAWVWGEWACTAVSLLGQARPGHA